MSQRLPNGGEQMLWRCLLGATTLSIRIRKCSLMTFNAYTKRHCAECRYAECCGAATTKKITTDSVPEISPMKQDQVLHIFLYHNVYQEGSE